MTGLVVQNPVSTHSGLIASVNPVGSLRSYDGDAGDNLD